jgi:uncharacterized protein (TIGR02466 family)|tara:strand:+ start:2989 stop:3603 length:615 start_codon:yes stop_codon:yes gene_type:complete
MKEKISQIFGVPIGQENIGDTSDLLNLIKKEQFFETDNKDGFVTKESNLLNKKVYKKYLILIQNKLNDYLKTLGVDTTNFDFYITGSWATKHQKNHYAPPHKHPNSLISGCLYLQVDENSGNLNFSNRQNNFLSDAFLFSYANPNLITAQHMTFSPVSGDLFLFPSQLEHFVHPSNSLNDRYMIAFNSFVKGNFNYPTSSLSLN